MSEDESKAVKIAEAGGVQWGGRGLGACPAERGTTARGRAVAPAAASIGSSRKQVIILLPLMVYMDDIIVLLSDTRRAPRHAEASPTEAGRRRVEDKPSKDNIGRARGEISWARHISERRQPQPSEGAGSTGLT